LADTLIIHSLGRKLMISRYSDDGRLVGEELKDFIDTKCSGSVRISRYEFGEGALIVIEGVQDVGEG